jgi:hypothetical protein
MDLKLHYCTYWGLSKPPFDNIPDQEMYLTDIEVLITLCQRYYLL